MIPSAASLNAVADWNHNRACAIFRQHQFEKNHDEQQRMLRDYRRLTHNGDACRRMAWLLERQGKGKH